MRRGRFAGLLLALLLAALPAFAEPKVADHAKLLREHKDFRVRTQAALALGASMDKLAVTPLCNGLDDENRTVRIASATALGRLAQGGEACLKARAGKEQDEAVRKSIERALEAVTAPPEPTIDAKTRFYVAVDKAAGPDGFQSRLRRSLVAAAASGVAFAPAGELPADAAKVLARQGAAKGFSLAFKIGDPDYSNGQLTLKLSVVIMSYPGKAILGSFSQKGAVAGLSAPDRRAELELLGDLAEAAMRKFQALAPTLDQ